MGEQLIITFGRPRGGGAEVLPGEGGCGLGRMGVMRTLHWMCVGVWKIERNSTEALMHPPPDIHAPLSSCNH